MPDDFKNIHIEQVFAYLFHDSRGKSKGGKSNFDNILDYRYVYQSFKQVYNVDLNKDDITWWEYSSMLEGCFNTECMLSTVIKYRDMTIPPKASEENKQSILSLKHKYMLRTESQNVGGMFSLLKGASKNGS